MYTQCPECNVAFRVTAEVLKQAAGKVRCGGCGMAFNALEHLSEAKPTAPVRHEAEPQLPELTPDEPVELEADTPPESISAEQSAALLKTLDELAGSDIRIEDTGVEWRVLDEEIGEEAPAAASSVEQMRFDDNTPLPDDFDVDTPGPAPQPPATREPEAAEPVEDGPIELELGGPDEWEDLLDEAEEADVNREADEEKVAADISPDDFAPPNETVGDEGPPDVDTQFALQALQMGIDTSGKHEAVANEDIGEEDEEARDEASLVEELDETAEPGPDDEPEFDIPEMTEEEKTINMLIDQDLLSVAIEDEDGFASTIVQVQPDSEIDEEIASNAEAPQAGEAMEGEETADEAEGEETADAADEAEAATADVADESESEDASKASSPGEAQGFETIIMEGDLVHGDHDAERSERNRRLGDAMKARRAEEDHDKREAGQSPTIGMVAGLFGLALLLALQVVHQSREALATMPAFNDTIAPLYRMLGKPVTPAWDVTGWTVEATTGSTDENDELLTIYSRVANRSEKALPYPLVHVSLTDRFEEIIGSRVLEPAEYLASDLDPRDPVAAGNTFNAIIAIDSPSPDATGYKISVCYRLAGGQLRCGIEDFL